MKAKSIIIFGAVAIASLAITRLLIKKSPQGRKFNSDFGKLSQKKIKDLYAQVKL